MAVIIIAEDVQTQTLGSSVIMLMRVFLTVGTKINKYYVYLF